jgi:hypothetical protein
MVAGAVGAVGLIGAYQASSVLTLLSVYLVLALPTGACMVCLKAEESTWPIARAAWWTTAGPLAAIASFWLVQAFGIYGLLVTTLVVVTSPPVVRRMRLLLVPGWRKDGAGGPGRSHQPDYARLEADIVNRRFQELVSRLQDPGEAKDR